MSVVPGEDTESEEELAYEASSDDEYEDSSTKQSPSQPRGTIVSGEDPETDDEVLEAGSSTTGQQSVKTVVSGEESETDEEDSSDLPKPKVVAAEARSGKGRKGLKLSLSLKKGPQAAKIREGSIKTEAHIKLRARVVSFYQQIHTRLTGMYLTIAKNLTGINDSLSQAQQLVEKVNISVNQRERDLQTLNKEVAAVNRTIATMAPNMKAPPPPPLAQQQTRPVSQP